MAKRYDVSCTVWLSSTEDAAILKRIEQTYGNSKAERLRNYIRNLSDTNPMRRNK